MMRHRRTRTLVYLAGAILSATAGCVQETITHPIKPKYGIVPPDPNLADFMGGTIHDRAILQNTDPEPVSSYGLVGQLRDTGDGTAPNTVRAYMLKEMARHGIGDSRYGIYEKETARGTERVTPGTILQDPRYAIVRVDSMIPPGARKGDFVDAQVTCLPKNNTTSLAHGVLYETDLKRDGANPEKLFGSVNPHIRVKGPIVVNTAYTLNTDRVPTGQAKVSLRTGTVMGNGRVLADRPILLQLREPQKSMARRVEDRLRERFQVSEVAAAYDEAIIQVYVPGEYQRDWARFAEVVRHLYLNGSPEFSASKARQLAEEALKPDARLVDISYCWEGLAHYALPAVMPLLTNADQDVAFAAARAAACIGDPTGSAENRLMQMARTAGHPHRLQAVQVLGSMPKSSSLAHLLRELLDADEALVRIEAYRTLVRHQDASVYSRVIAPTRDRGNEKFWLDIVPSDAPPIVYASRSGMPRIAIIGRTPEIKTPITFGVMNNQFTISAGSGSGSSGVVTLYYRETSDGDRRREAEAAAHAPADFAVPHAGAMPGDDKTPRTVAPPVKVLSQPDLPEIVARLGGAGAHDEASLDFSYGEVVAIVQKLVDDHHLVAVDRSGRTVATAFHLQDPPRVQQDLTVAPVIEASAAGTGAAGPSVSTDADLRTPGASQSAITTTGDAPRSNVPKF